MKTKLIRGLPNELMKRKILRYNEAKEFKNHHFHVDKVNGLEVYFKKPGKDLEDFKYDMAPGVGDKFFKYKFKNVWDDMLNICLVLDDILYKKLMVILYRMAYLIDYDVSRKKVRFHPSEEINSVIDEIQNILDKNNIEQNLLEFLYFIDILSWNEDMRYYNPICNNKKSGRINCIYGIIYFTNTYRSFCKSLLNSKKVKMSELENVLELNQKFVHNKGMITCTDKYLVTFLEPFLYE